MRSKKRYDVTVTLTHLLSVCAEHDRNVRQYVWFRKLENFCFENSVEFFGCVARIFYVLFLVSTHRHNIGIVEQDVGRHKHWVIKSADAYFFALRLCVLV